MRTWRLVIFGREVMRTETSEDADKTLVEAIGEMIEDDDDDDEASYADDSELRVADETEHMVFTPEEEDAD